MVIIRVSCRDMGDKASALIKSLKRGANIRALRFFTIATASCNLLAASFDSMRLTDVTKAETPKTEGGFPLSSSRASIAPALRLAAHR